MDITKLLVEIIDDAQALLMRLNKPELATYLLNQRTEMLTQLKNRHWAARIKRDSGDCTKCEHCIVDDNPFDFMCTYSETRCPVMFTIYGWLSWEDYCKGRSWPSLSL